jgi:hypothetical protein
MPFMDKVLQYPPDTVFEFTKDGYVPYFIPKTVFYDALEDAERLSRLTTYSPMESFTHLVEEVGEIATCLNVAVTGRKELTEDVKSECVDAIHCALELFFKSGGTIEEFLVISAKKREKWENNISK